MFDGSGAVTVDFAILTGLTVGLGYAVAGDVATGTTSLSRMISETLGGMSVASYEVSDDVSDEDEEDEDEDDEDEDDDDEDEDDEDEDDEDDEDED